MDAVAAELVFNSRSCADHAGIAKILDIKIKLSKRELLRERLAESKKAVR
jgi:hypothetical protein